MSKLVGIRTYERFRSLWENNDIDEFSLNFIIDTGQLYTHGIFINGAVFGTAANGAVPLSIAGITNTLALSSHTHSNYLEKNADIDISSYKIKSGDKDLLFYSGGSLYLGNTTSPTYISGNNLYSVRGTNVYEILDTSNFSVSNTLPTGYTYNNTAYIKYGNNTHQIDYVKRINTSQSFDYLNTYTQAGTNLLNGVQYGYITLYTDNVYTNPSWAQLRINIPGKSIQYRTSADANTWINLDQPNIPQNALNVAGIVSAPSSTTTNKVWKTDGSGNPAWRDELSYTFSNLKFQQISGTDLMTYNTQAVRTILAGSNVSFSHNDGVLTINAQSPTYGVVSKTQAGLAPQLPNETTTTKFLRQDGTWATPAYTNDTWRPIKVNGTEKRSTAITSGDLDFINGSNTTVEWTSDNKLKINSTWTAWKGATDSANGTAGYMPAPTSAQRGQFLRGDGSWVSLNNYSLPTASNSTLGGVKTGAAITDTTGYTAVAIKDGVIYYKDTNTTYSFSNLQFQQTSGTNLMTYNSQAVRTILAGSNITFTHSNNVLTIAAKDTTYNTVSKTAAGLCPALPNETTTTKYLRQDGSWVTPPDNNTWIDFTGATNSAAGTKGVIQAPAGAQNKFFRGDNTWQTISQNVTSALYVGASNGTGNSAQSTNGNVYLIFAEGSSYSRYKISGSGRASVTSDASGNITINSSGYSNFGVATASAAGSAGLVPAPGANVLGSSGYYLRADGTWQKPPNDNTWKAANASQAGYVPKSTANKILRANGDGVLYWGDDNNSHYRTYLYVGSSQGGSNTAVTSNPYLKIFDDSTYTNQVQFVAGNGITIASNTSGQITITNSKPDVNHNTDSATSQTDNNDNAARPILLKNGTGTGAVTSGTLFADGVTVNPSNNSLSISGNLSVSGTSSFSNNVTLTSGGLDIQTATLGSGLVYGGGAHHDSYHNIICRGNTSTGVSGIAFTSSKGTTSINVPSDCAFIQFHPYNPTLTGIGTNATLGTSGESNKLVIGVNNDADDMIYLQTPGGDGLKHVVGTAVYNIITSRNISSQSVNYATSAGNADTVDNLHASNLVRFFLSPMTSGAPADSAKSWFTGTMPSASGAIVYNVPGSEKTIIAGKSSGAYGHMLQLNYDDTYLRILRYAGGNWKSSDWEKISAGYADSAGSVAWSNVTSKPGASGNATTPVYWNGSGFTNCTAYGSASVNYASSAGNADTVDSEHASTFAHRAAANNLVHSGNEITMIPDSYSGALYLNYQSVSRNSSANITQYIFCNGKGGTLASITSGTFNGNCTGSAGSVAWSNVSSKPGASGNATTPVYWNGSGFTNCTAYGSASVNYANSAGSATYASSYLANRQSIGSSSQNHAQALQSYFNNYKSSIPRNCLTANYSSSYGNGSLYFGYFLSGYDSAPYGGFYVCHYGTPYYVGISNGSYSNQQIITSSSIGSQSVNYASSAGNADTVDSQHFKWSNDSNSPTYLWAANSSGTAFLCARGSMSVNYANSAGSTNIITRVWQRGNDCKATTDFPYNNQTRFYMYDGTTSNKPTSAAGFMMVNGWDWGPGGSILAQNFDDGDYGRLYTACRPCGGSWSEWRKVAFVNDIPSTIAWSNVTSKPDASGNATTPVYWNGSGFTNCTSYGSASVDNAKRILPGSYSPTNNTVAGHKAGLINWMNSTGAGIGNYVTVGASIISQWNNDSATFYNSSSYAFIKIGGAYSNSTYGQWLLSSYATSRVGYVGRTGNNWTTLRWFIDTDGNQTINGNLTCTDFYTTSGGFHKKDSSDSYVLLGGGGHATISGLSVNYANSAGAVAWTNVSGKPTLLGAINYNNNSNSTYQILWGSGNAVYGTAGIYCNPYYNYVYATTFYTTSDRSKKQDISEFSEHIRKFQMKDTKTWHYGVIAQEVPEMFRDGEEGNMTVNYSSILSYYVGCLENSVAGLEDAKRCLENKVKELEEKIKVLETKNKQI